MAKCKASCSLSVDVHRDCCQADRNGHTANYEEGIPHTLNRNPVIHIEAHAKGKDILGETHHCVCFNSLTTMGVDYIGYNSNDAELDSEVDHTQADDDRDWPRLSVCKALAIAEKATATKCSQKSKDWKTKFRLCDKELSANMFWLTFWSVDNVLP